MSQVLKQYKIEVKTNDEIYPAHVIAADETQALVELKKLGDYEVVGSPVYVKDAD